MTLNTITRMLLENNKQHILTQAAQIDCGMVPLTSDLKEIVVRVSKYRLKDNQKFSNNESYCYVKMAVLEYSPYKEYEQYFKIQYPDGSFDWVIGNQLEPKESVGYIITDEPTVTKKPLTKDQ